MPLWPRVSHYCIIVLIAGILMAKYQKSIVAKFVFYSFALLVCGFARPELFLPFFVCFILTYLFFFSGLKERTKFETILVVGLTGFFLTIYVFFKTPLNNGDSSRGIGVFLQHFAMNYVQWNQSNTVFWLDYQDILKENFKDASTIKEMIKVRKKMKAG